LLPLPPLPPRQVLKAKWKFWNFSLVLLFFVKFLKFCFFVSNLLLHPLPTLDHLGICLRTNENVWNISPFLLLFLFVSVCNLFLHPLPTLDDRSFQYMPEDKWKRLRYFNVDFFSILFVNINLLKTAHILDRSLCTLIFEL